MESDSRYSETMNSSTSFAQNGTSFSLDGRLSDQLFSEPVDKIEAEISLLNEYALEKKISEIQSSPRKGHDDENEPLSRRSSTPFIKTVMAERTIAEYDKFTMHAWAEFQELLKSNFFVIKNEYQSKEKISEELSQIVKSYNTLHLKIRENNERIRKKLNKEEILEDEVIKVILDDKDSGLDDATLFVKKLLYYLYDRPKIIATIVKNHQNLSSLKILEETLCTTFYEDIIADEVYDDDLLRLLAELLEVEFDRVSRHGDLFHNEHFTNKIIVSYLKRTECRRYVKSVLKDPLLASIRETVRIRLNPDDIQKYLEKRQKLTKSTIVSTPPKLPDLKAKLSEPESDSKRPITRSMSSLIDEADKIPIPKLRAKKQKQEGSLPKEKAAEEAKLDEKTLASMLDRSTLSVKGIANKDVAHILERNFRVLKKHLSILIQSIFDNLHSMPIGLRILCKIIYLNAQKKFPKLGSKEYNEILCNLIFRKWISPTFIFPLHHGILDDFHSTEEISNNMMEIAKVLQVIFSHSIYPADDVKSALNDYIREIQPSVIEYYRELIDVNDELVSQISTGSTVSPNRIRSRVICISFHEVQLICEAINKQRDQIIPICPEAVNLTDKLLFYHRENKIFLDKMDPNTGKRLRPSQSFLMFYELISPTHLITNYLEEFNKMQGFSKSLPENEKLLCRAKHLLKQFLISIEDIKNIMKLATRGGITLDDVLEKYQDKLYSYESKHSSKEKTPMHISARFLVSTLKQLDKSYIENNYYRLYREMFEDFKLMAEQLDFSISTTKLQLLKGLDNLKRSCKALHEVNEKKMKAIKKTTVREFIKTIKIQLCITSPSTMKNLEGKANKPNKKKPSTTTIPEKIEITLRDEKGCIHERFAIIRELAANGGVLGGMAIKPQPKTPGNGTKPNLLGDDIFNINNYHCDTIDEFIQIFGSLAEVKEAMITGKDHYGVNQAIIFYYNKIHIGVKLGFQNVTDEEFNLIMDEIENYICKRLYTKVFPSAETETDKYFFKKCKLLEWTDFDHLEVIPRNRCVEMWEYAAKVLNQMDNGLTPLEKLDCIVECFKTITQVLELASAKEGGGGADETLPIMLYVLLIACPKRIHSNINFITLLRDSEKMQAREGYCFTQVESAVLTIESLDHRFFKMKEEEFQQLLQSKEIQYGFNRK